MGLCEDNAFNWILTVERVVQIGCPGLSRGLRNINTQPSKYNSQDCIYLRLSRYKSWEIVHRLYEIKAFLFKVVSLVEQTFPHKHVTIDFVSVFVFGKYNLIDERMVVGGGVANDFWK